MDLDFGFLIKKDGGEKLKAYSLHRISLYAQTIFVRNVLLSSLLLFPFLSNVRIPFSNHATN